MSLSDMHIHTLGDARKFDSMDSFSRANAGYYARTCTINKGNLLQRTINSLIGIDAEIQAVPLLREHICCRCEFVMRQPSGSHYLLRYIPRKYYDNGEYITGILDTSQQELSTFCSKGFEKSLFEKLPDTSYDQAPLIQVPLKSCSDFQERK